jgi:hypothetical protein
MGSRKRITGKVMVEFIFVKPDDLKRNTMMIAVAAHAFFSAHLHGRMVSLVLNDPAL